MTPLLHPHDLRGLPDTAIGGKARGLLQLEALGLRVPPWRLIPADIDSKTEMRMSIDVSWRDVRVLLEEWIAPPYGGIAVRSSAAIEDSRTQSHAGIFCTAFAANEQELRAALDDVAASAQAVGTEMPMAVIVQAKVAPQLSGVAFSANPAAADPEMLYFEAVRGHGGSLVEGHAAPTRLWYSFSERRVCKTVPGADGPDTLAREHADALAAALLQLEEAMECAVDVEWCVDESGKLYFLQARPATAMFPDPDYRPSEWCTCWFFDQRFIDPVTPITRTAQIPLIVDVAIREAAAMRWRTVERDALQFHRGQVYIEHSAFEAMLGGAPRWLMSQDMRTLFPAHLAKRVTLFSVIHYGIGAFIGLCTHFNEAVLNIRAWRLFRDALDGKLAGIAEAPPENAETWLHVWEKLDELNRQFFRIHRWSVLWAEYAWRVFRGVLWLRSRARRETLELAIMGALDLPTARANAALHAFLDAPTEDNKATLISEFGCRSASLDYATPTWAELLESDDFKAQLPVLNTPHTLAAPGPLSSLASFLSFPLRRWLEMREEQRFFWEKILARQRRMLLDAGARMTAASLLEKPGDVFWLEWDELRALLERRAVAEVRERIVLRRHAHVVNMLLPKPLFLGPEAPAPQPRHGALLGIGASAGKVQGPAAVLRHPREFDPEKHGDCIIVLPALDPAWSPLLRQARGWVIERGGVLSHAAILAREYRVPLVIGVEDACARIAPNQSVSLDGETGEVRLSPGA